MLAEGLVVVAASVSFTAWLYFYAGTSLVGADRSLEMSLASSLVSVFGTMLGFVIAAVTFLFGLVDKEPFRVVRASHSYSDHWAIFRSAMRACAAATLASLVGAITVWIGKPPLWIVALVFATTLWLIARVARVLWVIEQMIKAEIRVGANTREGVDR
jgi:hypothetical protein